MRVPFAGSPAQTNIPVAAAGRSAARLRRKVLEVPVLSSPVAASSPPPAARTRFDHEATARDVALWQARGDVAARDRVFASVQPLLFRCALRFCPRGSEPEDLAQELTFAVYDALRGYRPDAGAKFSTFLMPWIVKRARRWRDRERLIYVPSEALHRARVRGGGNALLGPAEAGGVPWCDAVGLTGSSGDAAHGGIGSGGGGGGAGSGGGDAAAQARAHAAEQAAASADFSSLVLERLSLDDHLNRLRLNARERTLIAMLREGRTVSECAEKLGCPRYHLDRALLRLRKMLIAALEREKREQKNWEEDVLE